MKKIIAIISATIELIVSLVSPQAEPAVPDDHGGAVEFYISAEPLPESEAAVESPLPEVELSPAPQDENGNITGPGSVSVAVSYTIE